MKSKNIFNYLIVFVLTFICGIGLVYAADYDFSLKFYEVSGVPTNFLDNEYKTGSAKEITKGTVEPGQVFAVGTYVNVNNASADGFNINVDWDEDTIDPWTTSAGRTIAAIDMTNTGVYPYDYDSDFDEYTYYWSFQGAKNFRDVSYRSEKGEAQFIALLGDYDANYTKLAKSGIMYWMFFKVKDDAVPGTPIDIKFSEESAATFAGTNISISLNNPSLSVYGELSSDNSVSKLTAKHGSTTYITEEVPDATNEYRIYVPNAITSVDLSTILNDSSATVVGGSSASSFSARAASSEIALGSKNNLTLGDNDYNFAVQAANGDVATYTVHIYRLNNAATLKSLTNDAVTFNEPFNASTLKYTASVPYATNSINISADVTDNINASIKSGTGAWALSTGKNTKTVTVQAEECSKTTAQVPGNVCTETNYDLEVTRVAASTISTLNTLTIDGVTPSTFVADNDNPKVFTLDATNANSINIAATTTDSNASIKAGDTGSKALTAGDNSFNIEVTAEDGTTKTIYTINIRKKKSVATLGTLTIDGISVTGFVADSATPNSFTVKTNASSITLGASVTTDSGATLGGESLGAKTLSIGDNTYNITVTPEDGGAATTYTLVVHKNKSISTLGSLTIDGVTPSTFVADSDNPKVFTLNDTNQSSINIAASVTTDSGAAIKTGATGVKNLSLGANSFDIEVSAENGSKTTYTINVKRTNTDTSLSNLTITTNPSGTQSYNASTKIYTYVYDETVTSASINVASTDNKASIVIGSNAASTGSATASVDPHDGNVTVTVTAEDTTTSDTYTIVFTRKTSSVNTLGSLSVKDSQNKEYIATFNPSTGLYEVEVDNGELSATISATASSSAAKINGGANTFTTTVSGLTFDYKTTTITVVPEDNSQSKTYTVKIRRKKSSNANLTSLSVDGTPISGFDGTQNGTYTLSDVNGDKASVEISYIKGETNQSVVITNNGSAASVSGNTVTLSEGNNVIMVNVTSHDGNTTYSHIINIKKLSNNTSITLNVTSNPNGTLSEDNANKTYTYKYDRSVTNALVSVTAANSNAKIAIGANTQDTGTSSATYNPKTDGPVTITVTAEDLTVATYTLKFEQLKDTNNNLSALSVKENGTNELITNFNGTGPYNYTVDSNSGKVVVNATLASTYAKLEVNGVGVTNNTDYDVILNSGVNTIKVKVIAEDETTQEYVVNITRPVNSSTSLTDLSVTSPDDATAYTMTPSFSASEANYKVVVDYNVTSVKINATATTGATITAADLGVKNNLVVGDNIFVINITAENGSTGSYTVVVHRKSNDASITGITSDKGTITKVDDHNYTLNISDSESSVSLTPVYNHSDAGATTSLSNIDITSINEINFTVEAEDTSFSDNYKVTINKLASDKSLASITINGNDITTYGETFNSTKDNYTINVPFDTTSVVIVATPSDSNANVVLNETADFTGNSKAYIFTVTAEDSSTKTYTVNVNRNANADTSIDVLTVKGITAIWNSTTNKYEVTLTDSEVENIGPTDISATFTNGASLTNKGSDTALTNLKTDYTIEVTAADNTTKKSYDIEITRPASTVDTLSSLSSDVGTLSPSFGSGITSYKLTLPKDTTGFNISADTTSIYASISGTGAYTVGSITDNKVLVIVTPESGDTKTYEIEVEIEKNTTNDLTSISVDNETLNETFNKDTLNYTVDVTNETTSATVRASIDPTSGATLKMGKDGETLSEVDNYTYDNLVEGNNVAKIEVTSESGDTKIYTVTIIRAASTGLDKITSTVFGHTIDDDYVLSGTPLTDIATFKTQFDNPVNELKIYQSDGTTETEVTSGNVGTDMIIKLERDGVVKDSKAIVIFGDTTGDGDIGIPDAVLIANHYLGTNLLEGAKFKAGDTNKSGDIEIPDAVLIVNHYLGTASLH